MTESIINKTIMTVMLGFLITGGVVAVLGIFRSAEDTKRVSGYVIDEYDADIFI